MDPVFDDFAPYWLITSCFFSFVKGICLFFYFSEGIPSGHPILHPIICGGKGKRMSLIGKAFEVVCFQFPVTGFLRNRGYPKPGSGNPETDSFARWIIHRTPKTSLAFNSLQIPDGLILPGDPWKIFSLTMPI